MGLHTPSLFPSTENRNWHSGATQLILNERGKESEETNTVKLSVIMEGALALVLGRGSSPCCVTLRDPLFS